MKTFAYSGVVLRSLGILLLAAAILKGFELLTTPVANRDLWSYRPFLIFQTEFEMAMALWLLSGMYKRMAWISALSCFGLFSCFTLYKALTGAASCGCFGAVQVNPWVTLFAVDLPAVVLLLLIRPKGAALSLQIFLRRVSEASLKLRGDAGTRARWFRCLSRSTRRLFRPREAGRFVSGASFAALIVVSASAVVLAKNKPEMSTSEYEVLEPLAWVDKAFPISAEVDIAEELAQGNWLVLLYHHDCPDCAKAVPVYEQMARDLDGNDDFLRIALVEMPPYGDGPVSKESPCLLGKLSQKKEWFVTTPAVALLQDGRVASAWEGEAPEFDTVMERMADLL